jgi:spermidine/putrescine transport system substrate-binding protein
MTDFNRTKERHWLTRRRFLKSGVSIAAGAAAAPTILSKRAAAADELNVLTWCDHLDPKLIGPFEEEHGVRVNLKDYEGTGTALALLEQSRPGDWDVWVVNSNDVPQVSRQINFAELSENDFDMASLFTETREPLFHYKDGKMIAVPEKFGYSSISFNRNRVDVEDMQTISVLWNEKYAGRIGIFDWYQPVMQTLLVCNGGDPKNMTMADLEPIREQLLKIKKIAALISDVVTCQTALATGDIDILGGGAEFIVAQLAVTEMPELDWVVPKEGASRWMQSITILEDSTRKDLALKFLQYIMSNEGQARLATSECFWAMPTSMNAALSDAEKKALRWDKQPEYLANTVYDIRQDPELDQAQIDIWAEFLQA